MSGLVHALGHLAPQRGRVNASAAGARPGAFGEALEEAVSAAEAVQFSRHARQRLQKRNIDLSSTDLGHLAQATDVAAERGARDALMMMDEINMIVSVRNRTVVTVMRAEENPVYTNIDTAVRVTDLPERSV